MKNSVQKIGKNQFAACVITHATDSPHPFFKYPCHAEFISAS